MRTLYHSTDRVGLDGILATQMLLPSTAASHPRDVRYGNGQYLTDVAPGTRTPAQLSRMLVGHPFQGRRFTHFVEIEVTGSNILCGRLGVFVIPNDHPLDLHRRVVRSGAN